MASGVCVVGDDAQAIYGFRAASVENILNFPQQFSPPAEIIALEENYRSVQPILDTRERLDGRRRRGSIRSRCVRRAARSFGRSTSPSLTIGPRRTTWSIRCWQARERGTLLRHQAVLMRSSHHSDVLELELVRRNIPYVKYGGLKFLEACACEGCARRPALGRKPAASARGVSHASAAARCWAGQRRPLLQGVRGGGIRLAGSREVPDAGGGAGGLGRNGRSAGRIWRRSTVWEGQLAKVREWYAPHLHRLYEAATVRNGDLEQLERISMQFGTRERFLTELTLDPPKATGDLAGPPLLDEDYLILSTIHSAKGQEWKSVYVLNVADGHFPSEFATGKPELIEEERRLLYVAMTRAKDELHLIAPLKYYVTSQARAGDAHVYGAKSRFMTSGVSRTLEHRAWPVDPGPSTSLRDRDSKATLKVDAAARVRGLWDDVPR